MKKVTRLFFLTGLLTATLALAFARPAASEMVDFPVVKLQSLDKTTARTMTFEARVGDTIKYGSLYIRIQACRKSPPIEKPESAAFLQIWEVDLKTDKPEWVFSGWVFASSPALSPVDHPVYDVWVLDCLPAPGQKEEDGGEEEESAADSGESDKSGKPASETTE